MKSSSSRWFELKNLLADAEAVAGAQQAIVGDAHIGAEAVGVVS